MPVIVKRKKKLNERLLRRERNRINLVPIFKNVDVKVFLNFRPVSLTSAVWKLIEKIMRKQTNNTDGLRAKRSCITIVVDLYEHTIVWIK